MSWNGLYLAKPLPKLTDMFYTLYSIRLSPLTIISGIGMTYLIHVATPASTPFKLLLFEHWLGRKRFGIVWIMEHSVQYLEGGIPSMLSSIKGNESDFWLTYIETCYHRLHVFEQKHRRNKSI